LIRLERRLTLINFSRLEAIAGLMSTYLQLSRTRVEVVRYFDVLEHRPAVKGVT
jgi:hypothetical protein